MSPRTITALAATAAIAAAGVAPATGAAKATTTGKHTVTERAYVTQEAGRYFTGTMFKNQTFKVKRLSRSGKYAYGMAYGHVNRHAWIEASALKKKR